ncbi:MAG: hypothetical protein ACK5O3_16995 [Burkholderiales bacterium]|jgi:hypothetical protein
MNLQLKAPDEQAAESVLDAYDELMSRTSLLGVLLNRGGLQLGDLYKLDAPAEMSAARNRVYALVQSWHGRILAHAMGFWIWSFLTLSGPYHRLICHFLSKRFTQLKAEDRIKFFGKLELADWLYAVLMPIGFVLLVRMMPVLFDLFVQRIWT